MSLTIRSVDRQDYDQWLPLWDGYNAFYGRSGPTTLAPEITRMTWQRFFDAYEPMHALVAESGGRLLGLTHYLFHRSTTAIEPSTGRRTRPTLRRSAFTTRSRSAPASSSIARYSEPAGRLWIFPPVTRA